MIVVVAVAATAFVSVDLVGHHSAGPAPVATGTGPVTLCGHTLAYPPAADRTVHELPRRDGDTNVALRWGSDDEYLLRLSDSCAHGASISVTPYQGVVSIASTVVAGDGLPVAVAIRPERGGSTDLVVRDGTQQVASVTFTVKAVPGG